jgi:hypothetical protein
MILEHPNAAHDVFKYGAENHVISTKIVKLPTDPSLKWANSPMTGLICIKKAIGDCIYYTKLVEDHIISTLMQNKN